jgi:internalin A
MILGNGHAGKTQIVRRLTGEAFDPNVPSTHGIQNKEVKLATECEELPIVLRIWDFGGQDIYHGTHALFLKSRAVFPIVWSADTTEKEEHERHGHRWRNYPLDYWLAYVKHFGGRHSPVLLVQAKVA